MSQPHQSTSGLTKRGRPRTRRWLARAVPGGVLALTAVVQMWLATNGTLTPWKGGGYGMFATTDSPGSRGIVVQCTDARDDSCTVDLSPAFDQPNAIRKRVRRIIFLPGHDRLNELAVLIITSRVAPAGYASRRVLQRASSAAPQGWFPMLERDTSAMNIYVIPRREDVDISANTLASLNSVTLEVRRIQFDVNTGTVWSEPIGTPARAAR